MQMSTEWSRTVEGVSFTEGGRKKPIGPCDGYCPPPIGSS